VNADLTIHRIAFRETASLAIAQALVAQKRVELELNLVREQLDIERALERMREESRRSPMPRLDRIA
jgi:hypothetical protein